MEINRQRNSKYISLALGFIAILYIIRLNLLFLDNRTSSTSELLSTGIYIEMIFVAILVLTISKTRQIIKNIDQDQFMAAITVSMIPLKAKKYQKHNIEKIEIEQDDKKYYCLRIKFKDHSNLLVTRYPNLRPAEQDLKQLKTELGV